MGVDDNAVGARDQVGTFVCKNIDTLMRNGAAPWVGPKGLGIPALRGPFYRDDYLLRQEIPYEYDDEGHPKLFSHAPVAHNKCKGHQ